MCMRLNRSPSAFRQAADNMAAKLVLAGSGAEEVERFAFTSTGPDYFAIQQAGEVGLHLTCHRRSLPLPLPLPLSHRWPCGLRWQDRIAVRATGNRTDISINPAYGERRGGGGGGGGGGRSDVR
eukprot:SAG31_NODE_6187_length_2132_cov_1.205116_1_plen_124_part_00